LSIVFGHIGYFLLEDTTFLYPLSVMAGVGVNLFLFLSGFGLASSELKKSLSPRQFYQRRLSKIYPALWLSIALWLILDYWLSQRTYSASEILSSFLGFFPRADLDANINSVLWYVTFILGYYLIFPLTQFKKHPVVAIFVLTLLSYLVTVVSLPVNVDVQHLYKLHWLAFPLGLTFALVVQKILFRPNLVIRYFVLTVSLLVFGYTAIHSNVGADPWLEQLTSLVTTTSLILIFSVGRLNFRLFQLFGLLSYEIYLLHWPILSRYQLFWHRLSDSLAIVLYLLLFLVIGFLFRPFSNSPAPRS